MDAWGETQVSPGTANNVTQIQDVQQRLYNLGVSRSGLSAAVVVDSQIQFASHSTFACFESKVAVVKTYRSVQRYDQQAKQ